MLIVAPIGNTKLEISLSTPRFFSTQSIVTGRVAAVFIAQAFGLDLSLGAQLGIIVTASLASIGAAAVPSAGIVMLVIVLGQAGIPEAGLALIIAVDRPLDMCRTIVNVTGDAAVSMIVAKSVGKLKDPKDVNKN